MIFVGTNYFLRFLLADVSLQHEEAKRLFQQAAKGEIRLFTSTIVFFEIYWVLTSFYQKSKSQTIKILKDILLLGFIKIEEREILEKTLAKFQKTNLELEDCYNLTYAGQKGAEKIATFDKKLIKNQSHS